MKFYIIGNSFKYELEKLARLFLPFEKFEFFEDMTEFSQNEPYIICKRESKDNISFLFCEVFLYGKSKSLCDNLNENTENFRTACERALALLLYNALKTVTGYSAPFGILTGVRPAKLMGKFVRERGESAAKEYFKDILRVSDNKLSLLLDCYRSEEKIIGLSGKNSFSLYISVPFCPSRCSYCSFVSHSVEQAKKLIPDYVRLLCEEIKETGKIVKNLSLKLETVYIGGGTPTTLEAESITEIMTAVKENFDLSGLKEYTVEAGRPDTVTYEKLLAVKQGGASRISINPQTLNDSVLVNIGRRHTAEQFFSAFALARKCGFDDINTDLIAGLPGDTFESFKDTVDKISSLSPENVTVHALSMKRASYDSINGDMHSGNGNDIAAKMVDYAREKLQSSGILPYYMYRQSKTVGNLENVGYAKPGYEGLYNVYIMDETHTILACGASAVTKLREPGGDMIERIFNFKYPYEYCERFPLLLERKKRIEEFYFEAAKNQY